MKKILAMTVTVAAVTIITQPGGAAGVTSNGSITSVAPTVYRSGVFGTKAYNQWYAFDYMKYVYGWDTPRQRTALLNLWEKESGWNQNARNSSSGAHGIPQALPGNKMRVEGKDWRKNPETQIRWGLSYIKQRYGNPYKAWLASEDKGWY